MNKQISNPQGTNGFEFVEFASKEPQALEQLFTQMGFAKVATHNSLNVSIFKQNDINFIINATENSFAADFTKEHGPCACGMAFRVKNAKQTFDYAISQGAKAYTGSTTHIADNVYAIYGIGDSLLYLIDDEQHDSLYKEKFGTLAAATSGVSLQFIDHLTHNVLNGKMAQWADFYEKIFNFKEIRFFDIKGKHTGLFSRALSSPCGKIKIPLNESQDDKSQIAEYLREYNGEGIQHIALFTDNIYTTVEQMLTNNVAFMDTPDTYYELIDKRLPDHGEDISRMRKSRILIDGGEKQGGGILLQIFTNTVIGPIFFEIIQRKGNHGFGEGNFQALFDSIELDQVRRGVI